MLSKFEIDYNTSVLQLGEAVILSVGTKDDGKYELAARLIEHGVMSEEYREEFDDSTYSISIVMDLLSKFIGKRKIVLYKPDEKLDILNRLLRTAGKELDNEYIDFSELPEFIRNDDMSEYAYKLRSVDDEYRVLPALYADLFSEFLMGCRVKIKDE